MSKYCRKISNPNRKPLRAERTAGDELLLCYGKQLYMAVNEAEQQSQLAAMHGMAKQICLPHNGKTPTS